MPTSRTSTPPSRRQGVNARLYMVEYTTRPDSGQYGGYILAATSATAAHSALGATRPRRRGDRYITYAIDGVDLYVNPGLDGAAVIGRSTAPWEPGRTSSASTIPIVKVDDYGLDLGYVQFLLGYGGVPGCSLDITPRGWLHLSSSQSCSALPA